MIIYQNTVKGFKEDVDFNQIADKIEESYNNNFGMKTSGKEKSSWVNSTKFMETAIRLAQIPDDCGILIEFNIPLTSKRVDFIITGYDQNDQENFVIFELKQWEIAEATKKEDTVVSFIGGNNRETRHPSYQASSYFQLINDFNTAVYEGGIKGSACVYLHNYTRREDEPLLYPQYQESLSKAPIFFKDDILPLKDFIYSKVGKGSGLQIIQKIDQAKIRPSKKLADCVAQLFNGNPAFVLLDEQQTAYANIINETKDLSQKKTIIIKGGPGTGKSVVSMNALGKILKAGLNVKFVAPNVAFRDVIVEELVRQSQHKKGRVKNLIGSSAQFLTVKDDELEVLIVDEAHRLKGEGTYQYSGKSQIEDIIRTSRINIFFIDDSQRIRPNDIGSVDEIKKVAQQFGSKVSEFQLKTQFRCAGAEGFINWLNNTLQIEQTANFDGWDGNDFDFKLVSTPQQLYEMTKKKAEEGNKSRLLAGFAWKWSSLKEGNSNGEIEDVAVEECDFRMPWNGRVKSSTWAINEDGINQIGCVHTSQGLEFDYVGVIIGNDLKFDPETQEVYADYGEYKDTAGKKGLKDNPEELTKLVSNAYKVLMSRGMRGCYVYCRDKKLREHFEQRLHIS